MLLNVLIAGIAVDSEVQGLSVGIFPITKSVSLSLNGVLGWIDYLAGVLNRGSAEPLEACMIRLINFAELLDILTTEWECVAGQKSMNHGI